MLYDFIECNLSIYSSVAVLDRFWFGLRTPGESNKLRLTFGDRGLFFGLPRGLFIEFGDGEWWGL